MPGQPAPGYSSGSVMWTPVFFPNIYCIYIYTCIRCVFTRVTVLTRRPPPFSPVPLLPPQFAFCSLDQPTLPESHSQAGSTSLRRPPAEARACQGACPSTSRARRSPQRPAPRSRQHLSSDRPKPLRRKPAAARSHPRGVRAQGGTPAAFFSPDRNEASDRDHHRDAIRG